MNSTESYGLNAASVGTPSQGNTMTPSARTLITLAAAGILSALVGCSTTPASLPTVDDTQRRPVNSAAALELLSCRAETQALRLNLLDPAHSGARAAACSGLTAPAQVPKSDGSPKDGSRSSRAIFEFEPGKTDLVLDDTTRQVLRRTAQNADVVLVHAAGQAAFTDSESEVRARGHATAQALVDAGIDPQKLRVSWSVPEAAKSRAPADKKTSSVVEVEFVERSSRLLFSKPADPATPARAMQNPMPTGDSVKPSVASLDRAGKAGHSGKAN